MIKMEEIIKNKLKHFEYSNKASDWNEFERRLPKKKISLTKYISVGIAAAVLITAISVYLTNDNIKTEPNKTVIQITNSNSNNKTIDNKENNINSDNNIAETNNSKNNKDFSNTEVLITDNVTQNQVINDKTEETSENSNNNELINPDETSADIVTTDNYKPNSLFSVSEQTGCLPLNSSFIAKENHEDISYKWEFSDGYKSNKKTVKHVFKKAGEYTVKLITEYKGNNKISTTEQKITVYPNPPANFSYTKDEDAYYFDGPDNNNNITWNFGDNSTSTEIDPEHRFKLIGKTDVILTVKNEYGCSSSKKENINIEPIFKIANAFSPDNNGYNDAFGPIFEYPENYEFDLYIYNAKGKLYFKSTSANQSWNGKINNTDQLAEKGYYLWKLLIKDEYGNKIIKNGNLNITN